MCRTCYDYSVLRAMGLWELIPPEFHNAHERTYCRDPITNNEDPDERFQPGQGGEAPEFMAVGIRTVHAMVRGNFDLAMERNNGPVRHPIHHLLWMVRTETVHQLQEIAPQRALVQPEVVVRREVDRLQAQHTQMNHQYRNTIIELVRRAIYAHTAAAASPLQGHDDGVDVFISEIRTVVMGDLVDIVRLEFQGQLRDAVHQQMMALRQSILVYRQGQQQYRAQARGQAMFAGGVWYFPAVGAPIVGRAQAQGPLAATPQPQPQPQVQGHAPPVNMGQNGMNSVDHDGGAAVDEPARPVAPTNVPDAPDAPNASNATGQARTTYDWDAAPGHTKTRDQRYQVKCPECSPRHRTLSATSMLNHFRCHHRDDKTYRKYFGGSPPAIVPCPISDCEHPGFKAKRDIPDHLLKLHGIEREGHRKNVADLRRMKLAMLIERLAEEAKTLNELKRRIREAEARLQARGGGYVSRHGLNVTRVWPETDPTANHQAVVEVARLRAAEPRQAGLLNLFVARILLDVRIEADEVGRLPGGDAGTYVEVAEELERLVGGEPADAAEGERDVDEQEDPAPLIDFQPQVEEEEDDIYSD